jgi:hypothetical protein
MSSSKIIDLYRDFAPGDILTWKGEGGRVEPERRGVGQQGRVRSQSWVENATII